MEVEGDKIQVDAQGRGEGNALTNPHKSPRENHSAANVLTKTRKPECPHQNRRCWAACERAVPGNLSAQEDG